MSVEGSKLDFEGRMNTFKFPRRWEGPVEDRTIAEAGFIYTGQKDLVRCCNCNINLDRWTKDMDPLLRHKEESPNCSFVRHKLQEGSLKHLDYNLTNSLLQTNEEQVVPEVTQPAAINFGTEIHSFHQVEVVELGAMADSNNFVVISSNVTVSEYCSMISLPADNDTGNAFQCSQLLCSIQGSPRPLLANSEDLPRSGVSPDENNTNEPVLEDVCYYPSQECPSFCPLCMDCQRERMNTRLHNCYHVCLCGKCAEYLMTTARPQCPYCGEPVCGYSTANLPQP